MAKFHPAEVTTIDGIPVTEFSRDRQLRYMVDAVDDLRSQLVHEYPYNRDALVKYGSLKKRSEGSDVNFAPRESLLSGKDTALAPQIKWYTKMPNTRHLGTAYYHQNLIALSNVLTLEDALKTFRHEYAHMATHFISRSMSSHGKTWKQWARILETPPYSYHVGRLPLLDQKRGMHSEWKPDEKRWYKPLRALDAQTPIDASYEGRVVAENYLKHGGNLIKQLVALHPNPYFAATIANSPHISLITKAEIISKDVLPKEMEADEEGYKADIDLKSHHYQLSPVDVEMFPEISNDSPDSPLTVLKSSDLITQPNGVRLVEARREALHLILDRNLVESISSPDTYQAIKNEIEEADTVLRQHIPEPTETADQVLEDDSVPGVIDDAPAEAVDPATEALYKRPKFDHRNPKNWVEFRLAYINSKRDAMELTGVAYADESKFDEYREQALEYNYMINTGSIPNPGTKEEIIADKAFRISYNGNAIDFTNPDVADVVELLNETQLMPDLYKPPYSNLAVASRSWPLHLLFDLNRKLLSLKQEMKTKKGRKNADSIKRQIMDLTAKQHEYYYFIRTGAPEPRDAAERRAYTETKIAEEFAQKYSGVHNAWGRYFDEYRRNRLSEIEAESSASEVQVDEPSPPVDPVEVIESDIPQLVEDAPPEVPGEDVDEGWLEPVVEEAQPPVQADIPPPVAPVAPPVGSKHPSGDQVAALRELAEQMPELAGIARDAESYKPAEAQAVINDLAKELQRRQAKKSTGKSRGSRISRAPRSR